MSGTRLRAESIELLDAETAVRAHGDAKVHRARCEGGPLAGVELALHYIGHERPEVVPLEAGRYLIDDTTARWEESP